MAISQTCPRDLYGRISIADLSKRSLWQTSPRDLYCRLHSCITDPVHEISMAMALCQLMVMVLQFCRYTTPRRSVPITVGAGPEVRRRKASAVTGMTRITTTESGQGRGGWNATK